MEGNKESKRTPERLFFIKAGNMICDCPVALNRHERITHYSAMILHQLLNMFLIGYVSAYSTFVIRYRISYYPILIHPGHSGYVAAVSSEYSFHTWQ